jgi:hypothetical protein
MSRIIYREQPRRNNPTNIFNSINQRDLISCTASPGAAARASGGPITDLMRDHAALSQVKKD